jgi:hypothetical protein
VRVKRQADQGESIAYAATTFFSPFQKHCLITCSALQSRLSTGANWSVKKNLTKQFIAKRDIISRVSERCDEGAQCTRTANRMDVSGTGVTLPGSADVGGAAAVQCVPQLCPVLRSSGIKLSEQKCTVCSLGVWGEARLCCGSGSATRAIPPPPPRHCKACCCSRTLIRHFLCWRRDVNHDVPLPAVLSPSNFDGQFIICSGRTVPLHRWRRN